MQFQHTGVSQHIQYSRLYNKNRVYELGLLCIMLPAYDMIISGV